MEGGHCEWQEGATKLQTLDVQSALGKLEIWGFIPEEGQILVF